MYLFQRFLSFLPRRKYQPDADLVAGNGGSLRGAGKHKRYFIILENRFCFEDVSFEGANNTSKG